MLDDANMIRPCNFSKEQQIVGCLPQQLYFASISPGSRFFTAHHTQNKAKQSRCPCAINSLRDATLSYLRERKCPTSTKSNSVHNIQLHNYSVVSFSFTLLASIMNTQIFYISLLELMQRISAKDTYLSPSAAPASLSALQDSSFILSL